MWQNLQKIVYLVIFTEEILNGKFHFLCSKHLPLLQKRLRKPCLFKFQTFLAIFSQTIVVAFEKFIGLKRTHYTITIYFLLVHSDWVTDNKCSPVVTFLLSFEKFHFYSIVSLKNFCLLASLQLHDMGT